MSLKLRTDVQAGDINMGAFTTQMKRKATTLDIISEVSVT